MRCREEHIASMQLVIILCRLDDGYQMVEDGRLQPPDYSRAGRLFLPISSFPVSCFHFLPSSFFSLL